MVGEGRERFCQGRNSLAKVVDVGESILKGHVHISTTDLLTHVQSPLRTYARTEHWAETIPNMRKMLSQPLSCILYHNKRIFTMFSDALVHPLP